MIKNLAGLTAAISAVAPIDGVSGDGAIWFQASATPDQVAAGKAALAAFRDVAPQIVSIHAIFSAMTDAEYWSLVNFASTHPQVHRAIYALREIDLSSPGVKNLIQGIVTAGVITPQRAQAVFVAPDLVAPPPMAPQ